VGIAANLLFTAWATLTMNGGKYWDLGGANYPWHEFTIGAVGNLLMFAVGCVVAALAPVDGGTGPTLWDWLAKRRQSERTKTSLEENDDAIAQRS
jgi:hypothetical protein